jgi:hypothetical protein
LKTSAVQRFSPEHQLTLTGRRREDPYMTRMTFGAIGGLQRNNAEAPHSLRTDNDTPLFSFG